MDKLYAGVKKVDGEYYSTGDDANINEERRPFKAILDAGLVNTTTGNRVFAAVKGASDGGLYVPHSTKRFYGNDEEEGYNAGANRKRILGGHIDDYMKILKDESAEEY